MTTNQTINGVPRELLEQLVDPVNHIGRVRARAELRALLDAPTKPEPMHPRCTVLKSCNVSASASTQPAAQPQVEPVAYRYKEGHASWENENPWVPTTLGHGEVLLGRKELAANGTFKGEERDHYLALVVEPLYAEQPAPVAVNSRPMTELRDIFDSNKGADGTLVISKKLAEQILNPSRPHHANPPPGTEPSGTHHDNDGLDEMRKT